MMRSAFIVLVKGFGTTLTYCSPSIGNVASDPDCPGEESSLGHLVAFLTHGPPEDNQVCKAEWPWECLLLLEVLIELSAPWVP